MNQHLFLMPYLRGTGRLRQVVLAGELAQAEERFA